MSRKRPAPDYEGRHRRVKITASGQHRQDPLPPPDPPYRPPRSSLVSAEPEGAWSRWYDPSRLHTAADIRGIDPDIVAPLSEVQSRPTQALPPWMEPKRKIRPQYIFASAVTALLAVPALMMAGWIAHENASASTQPVSRQLAPGQARIPIVLVVNGQKRQVCITLADSGAQWTAWASENKC